MILLSIVALFLPVIIALFLTGFDFQKINLGGSAVWFCIAVPVVPIYLLKFGIVELHDCGTARQALDLCFVKRWKEETLSPEAECG